MSEQEYIERMKEEIRGKLKHSLDSPTDFDYLALQVKIVTGEDISSTTLKRFYGYINSQSTTRRSSLSILARYLGYWGWSDYVKKIGRQLRLSIHQGDYGKHSGRWRLDRSGVGRRQVGDFCGLRKQYVCGDEKRKLHSACWR